MQTSIIEIFLGKGFKKYVSTEILDGVGDRLSFSLSLSLSLAVHGPERGGGGEERGMYLKEGDLLKWTFSWAPINDPR